MRLHHFFGLLTSAVPCLLVISTALAGDGGNAPDNAACVDRCVLPVQYTYYPNGPQTPEQEYQERSRRYNEQAVDFYRRQQQQNSEREQGRDRGRTTYGAIAYSPDSGSHASSQNYASRREAESQAKRDCGKNDCEIAAWFYNSCGALARGDDDETWGAEQGANEARARQNALARCASEGGKNCRVIATACSR